MVTSTQMESDLFSFLSVKQGLSQTTVDSYCAHIKRFFIYLNGRNPDRILFENYLYFLKQKHNNHSINTIMAALLQLQKYYTDRNIGISFAQGFKTLKVERKTVDVLTIDEIIKILATNLFTKRGKRCPTDRTFLLFTQTLALTGARFSEIASLTVDRLQEDHILITKTKNNVARKIYITPNLSCRLHTFTKGKGIGELVFTNTNNSPMRSNDYLLNLRKRCKIAGINKRVYPHLFRHSMATQLAIEGVKAEEIKEILGHKDIATTIYYIHLADESLKQAMFKHPLLRRSLPPEEIIKNLKQAISLFKLETDNRFNLLLKDKTRGLTLDIIIKK